MEKKKTLKEIEDFLIREAKRDFLITWWMSKFYENFCKFMDWDFNDLKGNPKKIRYYLNKLVKKRILVSHSGGTGIGGKMDFGMTYNKNWFLRDRMEGSNSSQA